MDIINKKFVLRFLLAGAHVDILSFINSWKTRCSIINTEFLATYNILNAMEYQYYRINISKNLITPDDTNTNRIERVFSPVKIMMRLYNYQNINPTNLNLI